MARPKPKFSNNKKQCSICGRFKPLSEFHVDKGQSSGLACACKECRKTQRRTRYDKSGERERVAHSYEDVVRGERYQRKYGITIGDYEALLSDQDNKCAICGITQKETGKRLFVDHDHDTGNVRGLLCSHCNTGLGMFRDSPEILIEAISYLQTGEK